MALQINVRFDEGAIVFNSIKQNKLGHEEKADKFPFKAGEKFLLVIETRNDNYHVKLNGHHLYTFNHRLPTNSVQQIRINEERRDIGDDSTVSITLVRVDVSLYSS